jgi:hypothetical protein
MEPNKTIRKGLNTFVIIGLIFMLLVAIVTVTYLSQYRVERNAFSLPTGSSDQNTLKQKNDVFKSAAEIRKIRSETAGSLFWLKMIALFVTVGGAVGGYLWGQSHSSLARIEFEDRKNVDIVYQSIIKELSDNSPVLRATAAVKLGAILESFPDEWLVSPVRLEQIIQLTKQVIAAALAIEKDNKVLKTLSISLVLHKPWKEDLKYSHKKEFGDVSRLDLSRVQAEDAYWAWTDFTKVDFYKANLAKSSFREAILVCVQFRETNLTDSVLINANCEGANFKLADLRKSNFTGANLVKANFEGAKVAGANLTGTKVGENPDTTVDISPKGDGSIMINVNNWLSTRNKDAS